MLPGMTPRLFAAVLASISIVTTLRAEVFNAGYTFTYHFDKLSSFQANAIIPENFLLLDSGAIHPTATISWEIFDSLPTGAPVASGIWDPGELGVALVPSPVWQDGEGSFRITILSGSQNINAFDIYVAHHDSSRLYTVYSGSIQPTSVPEPATFVLLAIGSAFLVLWRRARVI